VNLSEDGGNTVLAYTVKAMIGGKLAQLGARLIDGVAPKLAEHCSTSSHDTASTPADAAREGN